MSTQTVIRGVVVVLPGIMGNTHSNSINALI
jgi:hypothetical protein